MGEVSADFLLELLSQEIPARMQAQACADLARLFEGELARAGLRAEAIETHATPRRLALIARALPLATEPVRDEVKGPRASAPPQALEGFLRKTGLRREQLVERDGVLFAVTERPGRPTAEVLAAAVSAVVAAFPWPKSMRWGAASASTSSPRWVRPLEGIVALFGEMVVPCEAAGLAAGAVTCGHRFHHPGPITIGSAADYAFKLRTAHVIVDAAERRAIIAEGAAALAAARGLALVPDDGLVAENAGLTEWPVPLIGDFDPAFLQVPREVIQLTMRTNQKYFACVDGAGALAPAFVCVANIAAADGGAGVVAGNRKVLAARLADARFFWEADLKVPLATQAEKLGQIVFHEKLGTVADKVARVASLAADHLLEPLGWPEEAAPPAQSVVREAARLVKADLVSGTVGEFPELQGIIGGYIAAAQRPEIATALRDHYLPVGQGDRLPADAIATVIGLADRADTLYGFFAATDERPTGSRDPFALRRAALGLIRLIVENELRIPLHRLFGEADFVWQASSTGVDWSDPTDALVRFMIDRLKVQQREAGVRHDLIDAVLALGGEDDLVRLLARVRALQAFVATPDGANLLAGYKRAANILKKEGWGEAAPLPEREGLGVGRSSPDLREGRPTPDPSLSGRGEEPSAEAALVAALAQAEPAAAAAVASERFGDAMAALASLRAPIDAFFEQVIVNDPDPAARARRLGLLARIRDAVHQVADFSRIEG